MLSLSWSYDLNILQEYLCETIKQGTLYFSMIMPTTLLMIKRPLLLAIKDSKLMINTIRSDLGPESLGLYLSMFNSKSSQFP